MPQNKIKNPFSSISNKDQNFLKSDLFQFGMDEGIPRNQNVIQNAGMILQDSRTPKTALSPIGLPDLPEPEQETESMTQDDNQSRFLASLLGQGAAMFGGAIAGRDPMKIAEQFSGERLLQDRMAQAREQEQYTRGEREFLKQEQNRIRIANEEQRKLAIEQAKNLMNPDSEESKRKRMIYERALGIKIPGEFSASDLEDRNVLQGLVAQSQSKPVPGRVGGGVSQPKEVKPKDEKEKKNPFLKEMTDVRYRSQNALDALNKIEDIVRRKGTTELFGSEGKELEQLIQNVAINYNKVLDPGSVVRTEEAENVANSLGIGGFGGALTSTNTALKQIEAFKNLVINSRNNALNAYTNLPSNFDFSDQEQFIIEEYRKNPSDPEISETYNNMLRSKGLR